MCVCVYDGGLVLFSHLERSELRSRMDLTQRCETAPLEFALTATAISHHSIQPEVSTDGEQHKQIEYMGKNRV